MRIALTGLAAAILFAGLSSPVWAQRRHRVPDVSGAYEVKFEEVQNSCTASGMKLRKATVKLTQRGERTLKVKIPMVPDMTGRVSKGGKFKAKADKGKTPIKGLDGRFSISGRVNDGVIQFVFIAEYYKGDKPLCTQSWNGNGVNKDKL